MKKKKKIALITIACILGAGAIAFFAYTSDYYHADQTATEAMATGSGIQNNGDTIIFTPAAPGNDGLVFYPGGKVEYTAYIPLMQKLQQRGITCVLVKMPFNLAVFDSGAADRVYGMLPGIKNWTIGGHSLGGAMASNYASGHPDKIKGLILLGAY
ncbi:MAG: alpha/beta fold hydrolase, partial [Eubacteriales bacterium]